MAITVTKTNTRIYKIREGGWIKAIYDTGAVDAEDKAITYEVILTTASIELSTGVLLPKARIKAIIEAALKDQARAQDTELTTALA